jgi:hypothetical protein
LMWLAFGAQSSTGANLTTGVSVTADITFYTRFTARTPQ